jgi:peptide chain release factor subunit 1
MGLSSADRFHLKKFIKDIEQHKGRHTELVSVYVPQGYELNKIVSHLSQEQGTATNIKSKSTRDNVTASLEKMLQHLRLFKQTPPNGLALFAANVAEREGQQDYEVWSIEPPLPINIRLYRCDKEFVLEPLKDMLEDKATYGLVVMDRRDGIIAILKGKSIIPLSKASSNVPGKTKAGGQSAHRYERIREGAAKDFYRKLGEMMKEEFLNMELKGIIVGGPGPTKYEFVEGNNITDLLKRKIIAIKDLSYTEEFGLQELLEKSADILANEEVTEEKQIMQRFFELLSKKPGMVSYGEKEVVTNLNMGVVDVLLISEDYDENKVPELEDIGAKYGTAIKIISTETREGVQLRDIGKIAAILRYEV